MITPHESHCSNFPSRWCPMISYVILAGSRRRAVRKGQVGPRTQRGHGQRVTGITYPRSHNPEFKAGMKEPMHKGLRGKETDQGMLRVNCCIDAEIFRNPLRRMDGDKRKAETQAPFPAILLQLLLPRCLVSSTVTTNTQGTGNSHFSSYQISTP